MVLKYCFKKISKACCLIRSMKIDLVTWSADWLKSILVKTCKSDQGPSWVILTCTDFYYGEGGHPSADREEAPTVLNYTIAGRAEKVLVRGLADNGV